MVIGFCSKEPGGPIWHRTTLDERLIFKMAKKNPHLPSSIHFIMQAPQSITQKFVDVCLAVVLNYAEL